MIKNGLLCLGLTFFTLSGCIGWKNEVVQKKVALPDRYTHQYSSAEKTEVFPPAWWQAFENPELNRLVHLALQNNISIQKARAKVLQVIALERSTASALLPQVNAGFDMDWTRTDAVSVPNGHNEEYTPWIMVSYEWDIWRKVQNSLQAHKQEKDATAEDALALRTTVASGVVTHWITILSLREEKALLEKQKKTNQALLELVELRYARALVSSLDVFQQQQGIYRTRAMIPRVESEQIVTRHGLSHLLGEYPKEPFFPTQTTLPDIPPLPDISIPLVLLEKRPDIRGAGKRLWAASFKVKEAGLDKLPDIAFSLSVRTPADGIKDFLADWFATASARLNLPVYDGGMRTAKISQQEAILAERLADYRLTILNAVQEVEDALIREEKQRLYIQETQTRLEYAQKALAAARDRYARGVSDFLPVLSALKTVEDLGIECIRAKRDLLLYRVALYKALGGTWEKEQIPGENQNPEK